MVHDFYSGFEGEPEIRFRHLENGECVEEVRIWSGDFDAIMDRILPRADGWPVLARHYHCLDAWDLEPWRVAPIDEIAEEWSKVDLTGLEPRVRRAHALILNLLTQASRSGEPWIESC